MPEKEKAAAITAAGNLLCEQDQNNPDLFNTQEESKSRGYSNEIKIVEFGRHRRVSAFDAGFIYALAGNVEPPRTSNVLGGIDAIKIGRSIQPEVRAAWLQGSYRLTQAGCGQCELLGYIPVDNMAREEKLAHRYFDQYKVCREWFAIDWESVREYFSHRSTVLYVPRKKLVSCR